MDNFKEFLDKISPLKNANKLGAILIQLPPSFSVAEFRSIEGFLERLPSGYEYTLEFRHSSWQTEGPWEMLKHYNVAAVMTDSPDPKLQYLSNVTVTADHSFIRFHGRNKGFWYNYMYNKEELEPWIAKVNEIKKKTKMLRIYFNNHYAGAAVFDALLFEEMLGEDLTPEQKNVRDRVKTVLAGIKSQKKLMEFPDTRSQ
jgi:uncharacterized protein YecE (DUF72 family)